METPAQILGALAALVLAVADHELQRDRDHHAVRRRGRCIVERRAGVRGRNFPRAERCAASAAPRVLPEGVRLMRKAIKRADAEAIRAEVDATRGYPRTHVEGDGELVRVGGGIHVESVVTTTAVAITGDGTDVTVVIADADEKHIEPVRRARLRAAKEPVEEAKDPEGKR